MSIVYTTKKGDVLDEILWRHFGYDKGKEKQIPLSQSRFCLMAESLPDGLIEETYRLNPHLCFYPAILPQGLKIILPEKIDITAGQTPVSAWKA